MKSRSSISKSKHAEAVEEKRMAEILMNLRDYRGAREKLLQAQTLDPLLENINAMLSIPNILIASQTGDWYWVLQTSSNADQSQISSNYRMLTQSLQPLKTTNFPGTDAALAALHGAFSVLSDQKQRALFDSQKFTKRINLGDMVSVPQTPKTKEKEKYSSGVASGSGGRASKLSSGLISGSGTCASATVRAKSGTDPSLSYYNFNGDRKSGVFNKYQIWAAFDNENMPRRYARINWIRDSPLFEVGVTWLKPIPPNKHEKKWCDVGLPVACGIFEFMTANEVATEPTSFSHTVSQVRGLQIDKVEICPKKGEIWALYEDWKPFEWLKDPKLRKTCGYIVVEILTGYSKNAAELLVARLEKVVGFKSVFQRCAERGDGATFTISTKHLLGFSHSIPAFKFTGTEIGGVSPGMLELDPVSVPECKTKTSEAKGSRVGSFVIKDKVDSYGTKGAPHSPLADVSSEFGLVDVSTTIVSTKSKWSRGDFVKDQIWAVYDGPDSMPQKYVVINNVISGTEVCTTFLDPQPMLDHEIYWVEESLPFVSGLFKPGRTTIMKMSQFSHLISAEFCKEKSIYRIYPKKGEVWAVYKNWHPKWKICDYKCNQCQIVEVISDFSEGSELKIASLVDVVVNDSWTLFRRQLCNGFELVRTISRREMLTLSHQIQCFVVLGTESHGFPEGSLLLDVDALPLRHSS